MDEIEIPEIPRYRKKRLSKSDYLAGLQCPKHLWLRIFEPDASELKPDEEMKAIFEQGRKVGELARKYVPGGTLIDVPYYAVDLRLAATTQAINEGAAILYEAAFAANGMFVAVDILERTAAGIIVTEVKSSTSVHNEHLQELALQAYVLRKCGIEIAGLHLMHLNRECAFPDLDNLFIREDVTEETEPLVSKVEEIVRAQASVLSGDLPIVQIGAHCLASYECPFTPRCWSHVPSHHVTSIHSMPAKRAFGFVAEGFPTIDQIPDDIELSPIAERQRRAVRENRIIVEPTLTEALQEFDSPIGFLDFETVGPAIPVWRGCHPYEAVPVQFSFCLQDANGAISFSEWLAEGPDDPREALARALVDACRDAPRIAAYNASFERGCLDRLTKAVPSLASKLGEIDERLVDLLPVVREHVYHPEFYGSFSLKRVFPVLTSQPVYEHLEISNGSAASWLLQRLLFEPERFSRADRARLRTELLAYCKTDTECLAKLLLRLREFNSSLHGPLNP